MTRKNPRHPFAGEEITGLPEGMAFFRPAQERLPELGSDWCVINIQIEHFKYFTDWFGLEASRDLLSRIGEMIRSAALQAGCAGNRAWRNSASLCPMTRTGSMACLKSFKA